MKKLICCLLVACMLFAGCAMLTSCSGGVDTGAAEANANAVLGDAMAKSELFRDESGLDEVLKKAMKAGAVEIAWEGSSVDRSYPDVKATLYLDSEGKKAVLDASLAGNIMGEETEAAACLYLSGETLMLHSPSLLGTDRTLALNAATVEKKLADSAIADLLPSDDAETDEATEAIKGLFAALDNCFSTASAKNEKDADAFMNGIYACLDQRVGEGTAKNADGKETACVTLTYTVNEETLARVADYLMETERNGETDADGEEKEEAPGADFTVCVYIEKSSGALVSVIAEGEVRREDYVYGGDFGLSLADATEDWEAEDWEAEDWEAEDWEAEDWADEDLGLGDGWFEGDIDLDDSWEGLFGETVIVTCEVSASLLFSDSAIVATVSQTEDGETSTSELSLSKKTEGQTVSYTLQTLVGDKKTMDTVLSYDKKSGALALDTKSYDDEGEPVDTLSVKGSLVNGDSGSVLTVDSYQFGAVTVQLGLKLSFLTRAEMPEFPTDATDILEMTEEELAELTEDMQGGLLGMLLAGMMY